MNYHICIADYCGRRFQSRDAQANSDSGVPFASRYCDSCLALKSAKYKAEGRTPIVEQTSERYDMQTKDIPWHIHNGTMRTDTGDPIYLAHDKTLEFIVNRVNSFEAMREALSFLLAASKTEPGMSIYKAHIEQAETALKLAEGQKQ